jgi:hypothetical protein
MHILGVAIDAFPFDFNKHAPVVLCYLQVFLFFQKWACVAIFRTDQMRSDMIIS